MKSDLEILVEESLPHAVMGRKLWMLAHCALRCKHVEGSLAELGVYWGGSAMLLARIFPHRDILLIDTFTGIPEDDVVEGGHKKGDFSDTSEAAVLKLLADHGAAKNAKIIKGNFLDMEVRNRCDRPFAFVNLDADITSSTAEAVRFFAPRVNPGGGIFFDDYTSVKCAGVKKAADWVMAQGNWRVGSKDQGCIFLQRIH